MADARKILVVDDDKFIQKSLERVLQGAGYRVLTAGTAARGLQAVRDEKPDLMILDIQLPDMSGVGVLNELCGQTGRPSLPILVLTGRPHMDQFFKGMSRVGVIQKPYTTADLLDTIQKALAAGGKPAVPSVAPVTKKIRAMILEDDEGLMSSLLLSLRQAGVTVEAFQRGVGILEQATQVRPDVLIVNRILSGMNGEAVAAALGRTPETKHTHVVMFDLSGMGRSLTGIKERCPNVVAVLTAIDTGTVVDAVRKAAVGE